MENTVVASSSSIDELEEFDQRELICNICNETMCFYFYWSKSHLCYLKLISYKYVNNLPNKKSTFISPQISKTVNTHYCSICCGFFNISQYKNGTIWFHEKCTPQNLGFFKNIKSVNIEKHQGTFFLGLCDIMCVLMWKKMQYIQYLHIEIHTYRQTDRQTDRQTNR